ncbi:MAG TPA: hypothetical protein VGC37_12575 [Friedmanniella sp.]
MTRATTQTTTTTGTRTARNRWRRVTAFGAPVALLAAGLGWAGPAVVPAAAAAATFRCDSGTLYAARADGEVDRVAAASATVTGSPVVVGQDGVATAGELGVARDGSGLDVVNGRVVGLGHGASAGAAVAAQAPARLLGGAVDPTDGVFYYGGLEGSQLVLLGYDPQTGSGSGPAARITLPHLRGQDGDLAFDGAGRLYVVVSSPTRATTYVTDVGLSALGATPVAATARRVGSVSSDGAVTGAAFADGSLFVSTARTIRRTNPTNAHADPATRLPDGAGVTDLGSCAPSSPATGQAQPQVRPTTQAAAPAPHLQVTQAVGPAAYDHAGQVLTWTSKVTNTGDTAVAHLTVTDASPRLPIRSCAPVALGGTLAVGASTTCTATVTATQDDLDHLRSFSDAVTASATTTQGGTTYRAAATATATATANASPGLSLTATASPAAISAAGQTVGYTFLARNRGNETLHDLLVTAPFAGLSALVCTPVQLGAALPPGATTSCRATRTITLGDLRPTARPDVAKVTGATLTGKTANATGSVQVATDTPPPVATDDRVGGIGNGPEVYLPGSTNDHPAVPGGPAIDPSRTVFVGYVANQLNSSKRVFNDNADWVMLRDGSVQVYPFGSNASGPDPVAEVDYRVYDTAGRSAVGHLRVDVRRPAIDTHQGATTTTLQNQPVTVDVLGRADPGENADGTPGSFDRSTLTLNSVYLPGPVSPISYADPRTIDVVGVGTYTVGADARITFTPVPSFSGTAPQLSYEVVTLAGSRMSSSVGFAVTGVTPVAKALTASVAYGQQATLPVAASAVAGGAGAPIDPASTRLLSPTATDGGRSLAGYRGVWAVQADGSVRFAPAAGFVGTTPPVTYGVSDANGTQVTQTLTVTVRPGPLARPDLVTGAEGSTLSATPLDNDLAGQEADGSPGSFVASSLVFPTVGQPAGSSVSSAGRTLTVPGEGVWAVASPTVTFRPAGSFSGGATPVVYQVSDDHGLVATGRITAAVTSSVPAATDDQVATTYDTPVRLAGATNDSAGSSPLTPASTVFPTGAQPPSATVTADGKTVTVPGQGRWSIAADGSATFTPTATYAGTTTPVTYRVVDGVGATADATLQAIVRPGPVGRPDVLSFTGDKLSSSVAENDTPGLNADGTLGTMDETSVLAATSGQPAGWVLGYANYSISHAYDSNLLVYSFGHNPDSPCCDVAVTAPPEFSGAISPVLYTAQDTVVDASGAVRHHGVRSSVQATLLRPGPVATNDRGVATPGLVATLGGQGNDIAGVYPFDNSKTHFPTDQLKRLPAGSTITNQFHTLVVAGQGTYNQDTLRLNFSFTPFPGFSGEATPVDYVVADRAGRTARATLSVTVVPGVQARADAATTPQGQPVTVDVRANDGPAPGQPAVPFFPGCCSISYTVAWEAGGQAPGSTVSDDRLQLTVAGQGVYTLDPATSAVTFDPAPSFVGTASPIRFDLTVPLPAPFDGETGQLQSTLQVTVRRADPVARPDSVTTTVGHPVVVPVLDDDSPISPDVPLVGPSVRLRLAAGLPTGSTLYGDAKTLTVPGRGAFVVAGNGAITFVPFGSDVGAPLVVGYSVRDARGVSAQSSLTVTETG